jgi:hypothetical protein
LVVLYYQPVAFGAQPLCRHEFIRELGGKAFLPLPALSNVPFEMLNLLAHETFKALLPRPALCKLSFQAVPLRLFHFILTALLP